ncbi:DUF397 domain-containing protein [Actinoplanes subglobosus]|uniref:DUF397 domain-containing protein n=1 Tax=Actinoplanes subglobosus TaxID=1547892 RepID=A0ABV8J3H0_9ACTN
MTGPGQLTWRKSRRSSSGACVEIADRDGAVFVRDSKDPAGPVLTFPVAAFRDFVEQLKGLG